MRDYAQNYHVKPQTYAVAGRSRGQMLVKPLRALFWKTAGSVVVIAMCTGVMASFWIGQQIQNSLMSIATLERSMADAQLEQKTLLHERDDLRGMARVEAMGAVQYGLYKVTPTSAQYKEFKN